MKNSSTRWLAPGVITALVVGAGALIWNVSAYYVGTVGTRAAYTSVFPALLILGPIAALAVAFVLWHSNIPKVVPAVFVAAAVAIVGFGFKPAWRSDWKAHESYSVNVTEADDDALPDWEVRPNRPQAKIDLRRNLGQIRGKLGDPTYVPNAPTPGWCAPVTAEAALGRVWTTSIVCLSDATGKVTKGDFPTETVGAPGGAWSSKLENQVAEVDRGSVFVTDDVYGYLDEDGQPHLVVPITKVGGPMTHRHEVPAGVVVFGPDGTPEVHRNVAAGEIPGPVMPMSIAERVRASLNARDGLVAFDRPNKNPNAYEATNSDGDAETADPNADNPTEFVLERAKDGRVVYVTPLTPYGASGNVVAYLEVPADEVAADKMPAATLYKLEEPQASLQTIAQTIASLYDADLDWAEANQGGDNSNKARLFELTPTGRGQMAAVIGVGDRSLYRLTIDPTLGETGTFGEICVSVWETGKEIRCDDADDQPVPVGGLRGLAERQNSGEDRTPSTENTPSGGALSEYSTGELIAELDRRAREGSL